MDFGTIQKRMILNSIFLTRNLGLIKIRLIYIHKWYELAEVKSGLESVEDKVKMPNRLKIS
jgi:hypothetical protein